MSIRQTGVTDIDVPVSSEPVSGFKVRRVLPSRHGRMVGPFVLFDQMGPAVFNTGQGVDVGPHPHIGLAAMTYLVDGEIVHRDSLGKVQALRPGEVSWMTAGSGIVHSERTPPEARASGSNFFGIQAWVALPCRHEEAAADFAHYSEPEIPRTCARGVEFTLIAGASDGLVSPVRTFSDTVFAEIVLTSGARYQVKPGHRERAVYVVAGEVEIVGRPGSFREAELILLEPGAEIVLKAPAFHSTRLMLLGGEPFSEPRHVYWNFVSSSTERIEQAKTDWRERRFPEVPGEEFTPLPED
ncbi:MAG: pirin family protein [Mesorhizobium sp.]|uniref:pirin family protein n=1 Tax=Mesorhizobium sp. TaxID=1871066 RepID=UPI000FE54217|nr:pirin family protein [Mesorhizobium sp.]RWH70330.1 MAG: pirin family protein [Mesorhizobium sp.]RWH76735.1 MAG: pirin family protein [Mesorhizobium sp.]RWH85292.1 MAG: pirin family protein [Mesorhizobium sp.]RWH91611.1 MAG: pirin family protein [Mesorhizobium sp.]RWH96426.1 MAG: pirin family protein [Mesorhizobium sp.]